MIIIFRFRERPWASMALPWDFNDTFWGLHGASMMALWPFRGFRWAFMATDAPSGVSMRFNGLPWHFHDSFIRYTWSVCDFMNVHGADYRAVP